MKKNYILDTNVLIHDPISIFRFEDNNLFIPIFVIEELDKIKSEHSIRGRSSREACRLLDKLTKNADISQGVPINDGIGTLKIYVPKERRNLYVGLDQSSMDAHILQCALDIKNEDKSTPTIFITMDTNLRVRSESLGLKTEPYDFMMVENTEVINSGIIDIDVDPGIIDAFYLNERICLDYKLAENSCVMLRDSLGKTALGRCKNGVICLVHDDRNPILGITPKNREQRFAIDLLTDDSVKIVSLIGTAGSGKAQPLDADILTPTGWIKMGDIKVGDIVNTPDGKTANVVGVFPQGIKDIYKVSFSDGTSTECCEEHLWLTKTSLERDSKKSGKIRNTKELLNTLVYNKKKNHSIPITKPVEFIQTNKTIIPPYSFGALLGDGTFRHNICISSGDEEIINKVSNELKPLGLIVKHKSKYDYAITSNRKDNILLSYLKDNDLWMKYSYEKHIPNEYKFASVQDRIDLLHGLMDTDGSINKDGRNVEFCTTSKQLSNDITFIIQSLGGTVTVSERVTKFTYLGNKKYGRISYRLNICMPNEINPFKLSRKSDLVVLRTKYYPRRYITNIVKERVCEAQCIAIDHPDHLYITNDFIVTHNTLLATAVGLKKVLDGQYARMMVCRPMIPMGKDVGFLPGDIMAKVSPWALPVYDNLELLLMSAGKRKNGKNDTSITAEELIAKDQLRIEALTYIRGRSLSSSYILVDEAQNLNSLEIKTIITRCGEGTKIVLTGDLSQIDNPYINSHSSGLAIVVEKMNNNKLVGHVTLRKGERSELATLAADLL